MATPTALQIVYVDPRRLKPFKDNPRVHTEFDVDAVVRSIQQFGWTNPILVQKKTNRIIAGHGRILAAQQLRLPKVPVVYLSLGDLDAKAYTIADNQLAQLSEWDDQKLTTLLSELESTGFDVTLTGFDESELKKLIETEINEEMTADRKHEKMEIQPFEHHDYLVFVFKDSRDFLAAATKFDLRKVDASPTHKKAKIGLCRVLDGRRLLQDDRDKR